MSESNSQGVLANVRVLEIGHFVAAPFAARLLADLGADVVKIEPLVGDPIRGWGEQVNGHSIWWSMHARNKRSIAIDLKHPKAAAVVLKLVESCDVLIENYRPGHLERLGLGDEALRQARPDLIIVRISGYGQTGPDRDRAAFGVIGEARGGLRFLTGHPPGTSDEQPPMRTGVSIGDSIAGLYAAFGTMVALWEREKNKGAGKAGLIDVAINDTILSLMEGMLPEYSLLGKIRQPSGSGIPTAAPSNAYRTRDEAWILIAANSDALFGKLCNVIGKPQLSTDPRFSTNKARVENRSLIDCIIGDWTKSHDAEALNTMLDADDIPNTKIFRADDCAGDAQFRHRGMVREIMDPLLGPLLHPGIVPHIPGSPGEVRWTGPEIGAHTDKVLEELGGLSSEAIHELRREGVIH